MWPNMLETGDMEVGDVTVDEAEMREDDPLWRT